MSFLDVLSPDVAPLKLVESGHQEAMVLTGITKIAICEKDKELSRKINVDGTLELVRQLLSAGIKPIVFSSDIVFDGVTGLYDEDARTNPVNEYARQKAEVEARIKEICKRNNYLIVRLSKTFSLDKGDGTFLDEMASILKSGGVVRAAYDQVFSPLCVLDLVKLVIVLQTKGLTGTININPPEIWSRYDLALTLAKCMGVSSNHIKQISLADLQETFQRPRNTSMKADKVIWETDYQFPATRKYIEKIAGNWKESDVGVKEINA